MMGHYKVSVVIPTFNCARYLPEAIESALEQRYTDYEIIVVDDGSTDNTNQVVANYGERVQYVYQENRGVAGARNTGIRCASGAYVVFLDADDLLLPDKLRVQATYLDQNPDVHVVYSDGYLFRGDPNGQEERQPFSTCGMLNKRLGSGAESLEVLAIENAFPVHAGMVRSQCVQDIGGFDEERSLMTIADWDLWYRLAAQYSFAYLDAILVRYRNLDASMSKDRPHAKRALTYLQSKIERSPSFGGLATHVRSRVYFHWGIMDLEYGEPCSAMARFRRAIQLDRGNLYAICAQLLTSALGGRAVRFYHLKRTLFGMKKLPGL